MTVKEITALEKENAKSIYLFKEGIFYRAYNRSAMRVVTGIKPFKINRKYVKTVQQEIFYIGFPCSSFETIKNSAIDKGWQMMEAPTADIGKMITFLCETIGSENYDAWVKSRHAEVADYPCSDAKQRMEIQNEIINFPLENATPMDAMMFVYNLKQQIKDGNV